MARRLNRGIWVSFLNSGFSSRLFLLAIALSALASLLLRLLFALADHFICRFFFAPNATGILVPGSEWQMVFKMPSPSWLLMALAALVS